MATRKPMVALVGRPNVGKSSLFNRLIGQRLALVDERPGTTRDRLHGEVIWNGFAFTLVDTGGLEVLPPKAEAGLRPTQPLAEDSAAFIPQIRAQAEIAIAEADVLVLVVDVQAGLTAADEAVAEILRRTRKPVLVAANKADNETLRGAAVEFYRLGLGEVYPISALHGTGIGELLDAIVAALPGLAEVEEEEGIRIAIVGRPNVGKSSLLNAILGEERVIVSPIPGTTRDAIDTPIEWEGKRIILIDTAGIRRRGQIQPGIERYSVLRALRAIQRSDVVFLVLDAKEGVTHQDAVIGGIAVDEARSVILVVNKWDLMLDEQGRPRVKPEDFIQHIRQTLKFLDYAPIRFVSAKTGYGVPGLLPLALQVYQERHMRLSTSELNRLIREALEEQPPPSRKGRPLKIYYVTQARTDPPTIVFFVNDADLVHFSYERYLENRIRARYPFTGTPLRLVFRGHERES
ncbi:ribosome biogenesis GTPase Der [Thermoflexus sp.]|uniref:ribosome biogenesis GTPase Der n=1 Tax=Thermoflexus sp. TaxID=1969742 RepID=UPI001765EAA6|nr:ribosome biogenesis GTPase Der [Thermoflexus sp.]